MKPIATLFAPTAKNIRDAIEQNGKVLMGNVSFGATTGNTDEDQNMEVWKATGTSPGVANTAFSITHGLGRIPIGFLLIRQNLAGVFYDSGTAWTSTTISLKCDTASVTYVILVL